jgi:GNAT superfamily N-acetyltransferase
MPAHPASAPPDKNVWSVGRPGNVYLKKPASAARVRAATPLRVTAVGSVDSGAVVAMLRRCSPLTRFQRFHGITDGVSYFTQSLTGAARRAESIYGAWVAGGCVGVGSLHVYDRVRAEIAVLVEDDWQRRGVGSALVAALAGKARQSGLTGLRAEVLTENWFVPPALSRLGPTRTSTSCGVHTVWVDLAPSPLEVNHGAE